ncbi:hypothetical protein HOLleu_10236 [Holothuria leucospilota]|uniref:Uncharacterized protein n=1 Tax=Holothuria leucospilota TaxID=206669 RepID=A0A9Q1CEH4_HOLLE|nr:hypothetical protein HOLleu_10236 [Holothuria leucospilota]
MLVKIKNTMTDRAAVNKAFVRKFEAWRADEYAQCALYEWERVENDGKLGREKHIVWNRGNESASMLAVRSICNCLGPDADPQAGFSFNVHLEDRYQEKSSVRQSAVVAVFVASSNSRNNTP